MKPQRPKEFHTVEQWEKWQFAYYKWEHRWYRRFWRWVKARRRRLR